MPYVARKIAEDFMRKMVSRRDRVPCRMLAPGSRGDIRPVLQMLE
jgi:hypothetical protein